MALDQRARTYLAATILSDGKLVSYRMLSRELKLHCNCAKRQLYEFYRAQNSKDPSSVHATYLIAGIPKAVTAASAASTNGQQEDGEDIRMQSSPYMSSSMPQEEPAVPKMLSKSIILAREEDFEETRVKFAQVQSVHIYSLGPITTKNLQILSECDRAISADYIGEDPLLFGKKYGAIQNAGVKRRIVRPLAETAAIPPQPSRVSSNKTQGSLKSDTNPDEGSDRISLGDATAHSKSQVNTTSKTKAPKEVERRPAARLSTLQREQSDIFKSFSKPRASLKREDTGNSTGVSSAPSLAHSEEAPISQESEAMNDDSEDEQVNDFIIAKPSVSAKGKSRFEREEQLRKMMDEGDEEMEDPADKSPRNSEKLQSTDAPVSQEEPSERPPIVSSGGRRRGRRQVTRKKTIKDEEGFLVTKEEMAYETFSEDESPLPKAKTPMSTATSSLGRGRRSEGKPSQGNIKSFFNRT